MCGKRSASLRCILVASPRAMWVTSSLRGVSPSLRLSSTKKLGYTKTCCQLFESVKAPNQRSSISFNIENLSLIRDMSLFLSTSV